MGSGSPPPCDDIDCRFPSPSGEGRRRRRQGGVCPIEPHPDRCAILPPLKGRERGGARPPHALKQRATASRALAPTRIERGDDAPRRTGSPRPLAKSGLDLAIEVQDPGLGVSGANPVDGRLYPVALRSVGVPRGWPASSFDPDPVLRGPAGRGRRSPGAWILPPVRSIRRPPEASGQRAGPVRLEPRFPAFQRLPGFPRRRVPRPLDVRAEWARRQAPEFSPCAEAGPSRCTSLCISVDGSKFPRLLKRVACPQFRVVCPVGKAASGGCAPGRSVADCRPGTGRRP